MTLKFGTDGVRGLANSELSPELALALGRAAARVLGTGDWVVGRDTRRSGSLLSAAFGAGLASEGADVFDLGVMPTPGVAHTASKRGVAGAMISASHNPFADNGVKLFAPGGTKLADAVEAELESELEALRGPDPQVGEQGGEVPTGEGVGTITTDPDARDRYRSHLVEKASGGRRLDGLRLVLDSANGAASELAADIFTALGASVTALHASPDGRNINERCGSTHPEDLAEAVVRDGADLGLAFDGDADRVLAVDHTGRIVDGDQILAMCAIDLKARGHLRGDTVVVTVMSNEGFRRGMAEAGISVVDTPVGDRHVLQALDDGGWVLGGEQSGHLIFRDLATTGDGMLAGVILCDLLIRSETNLRDLAASAMSRLPQVLVNVDLEQRDADVIRRLEPQVSAAEASLGDRGRVLLRPSGTEPLIRVMAEAPTEAEARSVAEELAEAIRSDGGRASS